MFFRLYRSAVDHAAAPCLYGMVASALGPPFYGNDLQSLWHSFQCAADRLNIDSCNKQYRGVLWDASILKTHAVCSIQSFINRSSQRSQTFVIPRIIIIVQLSTNIADLKECPADKKNCNQDFFPFFKIFSFPKPVEEMSGTSDNNIYYTNMKPQNRKRIFHN